MSKPKMTEIILSYSYASHGLVNITSLLDDHNKSKNDTKTLDDIKSIWVKWADVHIEFKDGSVSIHESAADVDTDNIDMKYPSSLEFEKEFEDGSSEFTDNIEDKED